MCATTSRSFVCGLQGLNSDPQACKAKRLAPKLSQLHLL